MFLTGVFVNPRFGFIWRWYRDRRLVNQSRGANYLVFVALGCTMLFACGPVRADEAGCRYVKLGSLPVVFDHFRPTVQGSIDGKSATMLVDTGASQTALTPQGIERLALNAVSRGDGQTMLGVNGESDLKYARVSSVEIGGIHGGRQDLPAIVQMQGSDQLDAIVGVNFLYQADLELNLAKPEVSFFQPLNCSKAFLGYWSKDAYFVETARNNARNRQRIFTVQVNGHDVRAMIDSGAASTVIDVDAAADAGVKVDSPNVHKVGASRGIGGKSFPVWVGAFESFSIGAETISKPHLQITDMTGGLHDSSDDAILYGAQMLIGADFLSSHRVLFANSQNRIYISYTGGEVFAADRPRRIPVRPPMSTTGETAPSSSTESSAMP